jgi:pSer/pThr/pTyr-binding forkhead associated (FHA) protein
MTERELLVAVIVLIAAVAALLFERRRTRPPAPSHPPSSSPAAPGANPLLHDATVLGQEAEQIEGTVVGPGPSPSLQISVVGGAPAQSIVITAGRPLTLGRQQSQGLVLANHKVSREHARLLLTPDGAVQLTDLGSSNGTFVGRRKRRLRPHTNERLSAGDSFWIGPEVELVVAPVAEGARRP